jgi:cyclophilin family peptidyl-prolyl cis-trans isomerase
MIATVTLVGAIFAVWLSVPEKKKEQFIDFLTRTNEPVRTVSGSPQAFRRAPTVVKGALSVAEMKNLTAELRTTIGVIKLEFLPEVAPNHVRNFIDLSRAGFYNGTRFHRVHPLFMIQGGDPNSRGDDRSRWGAGGADRFVEAEFSDTPHERGVVSMARSASPNSASSQFFICVERKRELDGQYTAFARVVKGIEVVDMIAAGARDSDDRPYQPITIQTIVIRQK